MRSPLSFPLHTAEALQKQQQQQYVMEQMRLRQMENARMAKEAREREKVYNETLYNMLRPDYKGGEGTFQVGGGSTNIGRLPVSARAGG